MQTQNAGRLLLQIYFLNTRFRSIKKALQHKKQRARPLDL